MQLPPSFLRGAEGWNLLRHTAGKLLRAFRMLEFFRDCIAAANTPADFHLPSVSASS